MVCKKSKKTVCSVRFWKKLQHTWFPLFWGRYRTDRFMSPEYAVGFVKASMFWNTNTKKRDLDYI